MILPRVRLENTLHVISSLLFMTLFATAFRMGIEPFFFSHSKSDNPQKAICNRLQTIS